MYPFPLLHAVCLHNAQAVTSSHRRPPSSSKAHRQRHGLRAVIGLAAVHLGCSSTSQVGDFGQRYGSLSLNQHHLNLYCLNVAVAYMLWIISVSTTFLFIFLY